MCVTLSLLVRELQNATKRFVLYACIVGKCFSVLIKFLFAQTVAGNERTRKGLFSDHHVAK